MPIKLKSEAELNTMREAGRIVGQTLAGIREMVRPGRNILDIEAFVTEEFKRQGAHETFRGYDPAGKPPYPSNICISLNEELVHGIPRDRILQEGDIVTFDLGATYKGFVGDSAITVPVGKVSAEAQRLLEITEGALWAGIEAMGTASHLNDVSAAIEDAIPDEYSIVREYTGHGVGREMHEEPQVPNYRRRFRGPPLKPGLVLALEPMVNIGTRYTRELDDRWTVATEDGSLCCHFEHTIAIRKGQRPEVLTLP